MEHNFLKSLYQEHQRCPSCPSRTVVISYFKELLGTLFPDYSKMSFTSEKEFELHMSKLRIQLEQILSRNPGTGVTEPEEVTSKFFDQLSVVHGKLHRDVDAMFQGDPAAKSRHEVIRTYPGFYAIAAYRIAHLMIKLRIREIPRMITEHAHSITGIDIHPGASIGESFCIDHGTGIVVGETAQIGDHVKLYQGVTLGALSVQKQDAEKKRHPTIEDNVVIYAGATILGGATTVGRDSIIGGNVWLTKSVPENTKIYYKANMHNDQTDEVDTIIYKTHA